MKKPIYKKDVPLDCSDFNTGKIIYPDFSSKRRVYKLIKENELIAEKSLNRDLLLLEILLILNCMIWILNVLQGLKWN